MVIPSLFMTEDQSLDWMKRQAAAIGGRVRRVRLDAGMSVQALADKCTNDLGYKMLRTTIANLEAGARRNVTLAEISVLAAALGVPPLAIVFPIDEPEPVEVLPGDFRSSWQAWLWFADGLGPFHGEGSVNKNAPAQKVLDALVNYALLAGNAEAWERTDAMIRQLAGMNRENEPAQDSLREEMDHILGDTYGALEFLESRRLPLPEVPERWVSELRKSEAELNNLLELRAKARMDAGDA